MRFKIILIFVFLFFFIIYSLIAILGLNSPFTGDQGRYIQYAQNLSNGFYTTQEQGLLWNGPGYPLTLLPFATFSIDFKYARLLNPLFLILTVGLVYNLLKEYIGKHKGLFFASVAALYLPVWTLIPALYSECQSFFLAAAFCYCMVFAIRRDSWKFTILAALSLGGLILTKCIFAYVAYAMILLSICLLFTRFKSLKTLLIYFLALVVCLPYLFYTFTISGKFPYWANSGGNALYSMVNPVEEEYGDWKAVFSPSCPERFENHSQFINQYSAMTNYVQRDEFIRKEAISQLRQTPFAYIRNYFSNLGRMFFNYPFAYKQHKAETLVIMVPTAFVFFAAFLALIPILVNLKRLPPEILQLVAFSLIFVGGSSLLYSIARYMITIVPIIVVIIAFSFGKLLQIKKIDKL